MTRSSLTRRLAPAPAVSTSSEEEDVAEVLDSNDLFDSNNDELVLFSEFCSFQDFCGEENLTVPDQRPKPTPSSTKFMAKVLNSALSKHYYNCIDPAKSVQFVRKSAGKKPAPVFYTDPMYDKARRLPPLADRRHAFTNFYFLRRLS